MPYVRDGLGDETKHPPSLMRVPDASALIPVREPLPIRLWAVVFGVSLLLFVLLEFFFRSGWIWHLPLTAVLREPTDVNTRAVWRIYNVRPEPNTFLVAGSSMADAVIEPRGTVRQELLDASLGPGRTHVLNLSVTRSCYSEQTIIIDNALRAGHRPAAALVFTWPGCAARNADAEEASSLLAERLPLTSDYLDANTPARTFDEVLARWVTRHLAIVRFRHYVNGYLRQRLELTIGRGSPFIRRFRPDDRTRAWSGPWEADTIRNAQIRIYAEALARYGPETRPLSVLLRFLRDRMVKTVVVEAPWSPPARAAFGELSAEYRRDMTETAQTFAATYLDLNDQLALEGKHFKDTYHVNVAGSDLFLAALGRWLARNGF